MTTKTPTGTEDWFCVEDCARANQPILLFSPGTLAECHHFIEEQKRLGRLGHYRVNYSPAMRRYLSTNAKRAA